MDGKLQRIIQLWQTDQKNHSPVPGVHLKVEQDLQVVENSIFDIVRFINDDNRSLLFIQGKAVDLLLDDVCESFQSSGRMTVHPGIRRDSGKNHSL